jgi:hypothetical protein
MTFALNSKSLMQSLAENLADTQKTQEEEPPARPADLFQHWFQEQEFELRRSSLTRHFSP